MFVRAQTAPAAYQYMADRFQSYYQNNQADSLYRLFSSDMKAAVPLPKVAMMISQLKTGFGSLQSLQFENLKLPVAFYHAVFTKGTYTMSITLDAQNKMSGLFFSPISVNAKIAEGLTESPFELKNSDVYLSGSLVLPKNQTNKLPLVIIIAGSGPTDRNGNAGEVLKGNSYAFLANALGEAGIATLRYDKRAVGKSTTTKPVKNTTFEDFVSDAAAIITQLKIDQRFNKIIVLGHSEGSLIGMLAAEKEKVNGFISVAGAGKKINITMAKQLKLQPGLNYPLAAARLDSLSKGKMVNTAATDVLFSPVLQPLLISWMKYEPQTEMKKLKIPVLIIQGTTDIQVEVSDAEALKKADPKAQLSIIPGMNHIMKDAPADRNENIASYSKPLLPLDTVFTHTIIDFVKALK